MRHARLNPRVGTHHLGLDCIQSWMPGVSYTRKSSTSNHAHRSCLTRTVQEAHVKTLVKQCVLPTAHQRIVILPIILASADKGGS
jgi:hypothetical protein